MIKKKVSFVGLFLVLAVIFTIRIIPVSEFKEMPLPVIAEVQNTAELIMLEVLNPVTVETFPLVTTTTPPITTTEPPVITTTPSITNAPPPVLTTVVTTTTTSPPITTTAQPMPEGTQWVEESLYFKMDGEQKYRWHEILGWIETGREGIVTVMDVQSDGHRFYIEPDGRVNIGKVVTPAGDIISYEEYRQWKAAY
jgi:hypothetical protein